MKFGNTLREAFLQYLQTRGVLGDEDLHEVLNRLWSERKPIGRMALESRTLTMKQVNQILLSQHETGLRFGEQAIRLGFITEDVLKILLESQQENGPKLKEIMVDLKLVDEAQYASLQIEFLGETADALV